MYGALSASLVEPEVGCAYVLSFDREELLSIKDLVLADKTMTYTPPSCNRSGIWSGQKA
jgi:hypothetical protein